MSGRKSGWSPSDDEPTNSATPRSDGGFLPRIAAYSALGIAALVILAILVIPLVDATAGVSSLPVAAATGDPAAGPTPEPAPGQAVQQKRAVEPIAGQPLRLRIPSIRLDAVVGRMTVKPGSAVNPPTPKSAYWLANYGVAGPNSLNTVYLAGHTCHGRCSAVFSSLLDIPRSATTVHPGDRVTITTPEGDFSYTVTDTALYPKSAAQSTAELWKVVPGRLVIVTCFQYNGGTSSQDNFVIYAQLNR